jgi:hypothetical protein
VSTPGAGKVQLEHSTGAPRRVGAAAALYIALPHQPPAPVIAERLQPWRRVSTRTLAGDLPDPPTPQPNVASTPYDPGDVSDEDALRQVAPAVYVQVLTGLRAGRDCKVSCPFHGEDRTPSLHVYEAPADGWYCGASGQCVDKPNYVDVTVWGA